MNSILSIVWEPRAIAIKRTSIQAVIFLKCGGKTVNADTPSPLVAGISLEIFFDEILHLLPSSVSLINHKISNGILKIRNFPYRSNLLTKLPVIMDLGHIVQ